jgi:hypothetical protein
MGSEGGNQLADSNGFLEGHSQVGLQMDSEKFRNIREANGPGASGGHSSSVLISDISGKNSGGSATSASDWVYALKDVSFEVKRYSSGMYMRLAFAVAAHLEPEPEPWAVRRKTAAGRPAGLRGSGEQEPNFDCGRGSGRRGRGIPKKCLGKMKDVAGHGRTILWN